MSDLPWFVGILFIKSNLRKPEPRQATLANRDHGGIMVISSPVKSIAMA